MIKLDEIGDAIQHYGRRGTFQNLLQTHLCNGCERKSYNRSTAKRTHACKGRRAEHSTASRTLKISPPLAPAAVVEEEGERGGIAACWEDAARRGLRSIEWSSSFRDEMRVALKSVTSSLKCWNRVRTRTNSEAAAYNITE